MKNHTKRSCLLKGYFLPPPFEIAERSFTNAVKPTMKASTHFSQLWNRWPKALRDHFVCGLSNESIQKKLLCEGDLTLDKAIHIAQAMGQANKNASSFHQGHATLDTPKADSQDVFKVQNKPKKCMSCGRTGHPWKECCFFNVTCHSCGKRGHISTVCMSNNASRKSNHPKEPPAIHKQDEDSTCKHIPLRATTVKLRTYNEEVLKPMGQINVKVSHNGETHEAPLLVVDGPKVSLFGRLWLQLFKLDWLSIKHLQTTNDKLTDLIKNYRDVFSEKLGCLKGTTPISKSDSETIQFTRNTLYFCLPYAPR